MSETLGPLKGYVAGAISDDDCMQVFLNLQRGISMAAKLAFDYGCAVFLPHADFLMLLQSKTKIDKETVQQHSLAFLKVCDFVMVCECYEKSEGTMRELRTARHMGIPIFFADQFSDFLRFKYDREGVEVDK